MTDTFKRELRYIVIKLSDAKDVLTVDELTTLSNILAKLDGIRLGKGKKPLDCVVVESDWPEYEQVWKMLESRVSGKAVEEPIQRWQPSLPTDWVAILLQLAAIGAVFGVLYVTQNFFHWISP